MLQCKFKWSKVFQFDKKQSKCVLNEAYEVGTVQTYMWVFYFLSLFCTLLEHKQISSGLESNKQESLYNKNKPHTSSITYI